MTQKTSNRKPTEIQSAAIYRCTNKQTNEVFYMVKSDSSNDWYEVRWSDERLQWLCPCQSVKPCKHQRAVEESVRMHHANEQARRQPAQPVQPEKANPVAEAEAFIAKVQAEKATKEEKLARGAALMESGKVSVWGYSGLHNANERAFEAAPSGRMVPMR